MRAGTPCLAYPPGVPPPPRGARSRRVPPIDYPSRSRAWFSDSRPRSEGEATMGGS